MLLRAERIGHGPTGDTSAGRAPKRLDDLETIAIGQPDAEQQVDMINRRVDVDDHRIDRGVGVGEQMRHVAAHRCKAAD